MPNPNGNFDHVAEHAIDIRLSRLNYRSIACEKKCYLARYYFDPFHVRTHTLRDPSFVSDDSRLRE